MCISKRSFLNFITLGTLSLHPHCCAYLSFALNRFHRSIFGQFENEDGLFFSIKIELLAHWEGKHIKLLSVFNILTWIRLSVVSGLRAVDSRLSLWEEDEMV